MTDLAKRLYDKCGGNVYKKSEAVTGVGWANKEVIATAASTGRLYITSIFVQPSAAGVLSHIGKDAEGDQFAYLLQTLVIVRPMHINLEGCPIVLEAGESLYGTVSTPTSYMTVRGYQR